MGIGPIISSGSGSVPAPSLALLAKKNSSFFCRSFYGSPFFFLFFSFFFFFLFSFLSPPPFLPFVGAGACFLSLVLLLSPIKRSGTFSLSFSFSFSSPSPFLLLLLLLLLPLGPFPRCTLSCCDYFKKISSHPNTSHPPPPPHT